MNIFAWSNEKNRKLQRERDISFELVVTQIETGKILDILEHPDQERCPGQRLLVVDIDGYAFLVPFVERETEIFLKTVIPSRKATKHYLKEEKDDAEER
ncbi:MAG: BrnT family toxin [Chlorobi bacterium]|nr:BrnT family toxin [Chlorobiota bacterium]